MRSTHVSLLRRSLAALVAGGALLALGATVEQAVSDEPTMAAGKFRIVEREKLSAMANVHLGAGKLRQLNP